MGNWKIGGKSGGEGREEDDGGTEQQEVTKSTLLALFSILSLTVKGKEANSKFPPASLNSAEHWMKNDKKSVIDSRIKS